MPKKRTVTSTPTPSLRERAEAAVRASRRDIARMSPEEIQRLVHELQVHQIELGMQNEELRRAQGELAQSRDRFNHLYDFAPVGYVTLDHNGTVLEANLAAATLLAVERGKLVGRKFTRFITREAQDTLYLHQRAVLDGDSKQTCDLNLRREDGKTFVARLETIGLRDDVSGAWRFRSVISDITERTQAEQALRASEADFRATFENAAVGIAHVSRDGRLLKVNNKFCQLVGYSLQQLVTKTFREITHPDDVDSNQAYLQQLLTDQIQSYGMDKRYIRNDGSIVWVHLTVAPVRDLRTQEPDYFISVVENITERKAAEEQVLQLNAELEGRVVMRTAELVDANRQLTYHSEQLRRLALELARAEERERRRLAQLLHDQLGQLLYGARLHADLLPGQTRSVAAQAGAAKVTRLIDEAIQAARSLTVELSPPLLHDTGLVDALRWLGDWMEQNHHLTVQVTSSTEIKPDTEGISALLFQCTRELLFNVLKHSGVKAARVRVERTHDDQIRVTITDGGRGFDLAGSQTGPKASFGLFSVRERLHLVGGRMDIDGAPGSGTRVTLQAPLPQAPKAATETLPGRRAPVAADASRRAIGAPKRVRILLVDDHQVVRMGLAALLKTQPDLEVVGEAGDGEAAIELIRTLQPDVVLMDIDMPVTNGIEATRRISADCPGVQVIGVSMHATGAAEMRAAGAVDFVDKAAPSDELLIAIRLHAPVRAAGGTLTSDKLRGRRKAAG